MHVVQRVRKKIQRNRIKICIEGASSQTRQIVLNQTSIKQYCAADPWFAASRWSSTDDEDFLGSIRGFLNCCFAINRIQVCWQTSKKIFKTVRTVMRRGVSVHYSILTVRRNNFAVVKIHKKCRKCKRFLLSLSLRRVLSTDINLQPQEILFT